MFVSVRGGQFAATAVLFDMAREGDISGGAAGAAVEQRAGGLVFGALAVATEHSG